jgi:hypothetical protein
MPGGRRAAEAGSTPSPFCLPLHPSRNELLLGRVRQGVDLFVPTISRVPANPARSHPRFKTHGSERAGLCQMLRWQVMTFGDVEHDAGIAHQLDAFLWGSKRLRLTQPVEGGEQLHAVAGGRLHGTAAAVHGDAAPDEHEGPAAREPRSTVRRAVTIDAQSDAQSAVARLYAGRAVSRSIHAFTFGFPSTRPSRWVHQATPPNTTSATENSPSRYSRVLSS